MMVVSYNDESADRRAFVVSGLMGLLPEWVELGRLWEHKLVEHRLPEFHAERCENRRNHFEPYEREQRDMFQREFYGLINKVKLWSFCTAVWAPEYQARWNEFQEVRVGAEGDFTHPYFLAFQHIVESMCLALDRSGAPLGEPVAFVFDQQQELEGRAKRLYDSLKYSAGARISYRHRLGSISFDSRFCSVQLQAADVWAYESRKYVSDVLIDKRPEDERWQFKLLRAPGRSAVAGFPEEKLDALIELLRKADEGT